MNAVISVELRHIIHGSPPKSCKLDHLSTSLLQEFVDDLHPFLIVLCNQSIQDGVLPSLQKRSILVPVFKRSGLDSSDLINCIANISLMSKIIENIANKLLLNANPVFRKATPLRPPYSVSFMISMGLQM